MPAGATGRNGSVTPEKVADWAANGFRWLDRDTKEWHTQDAATANTALRHEGSMAFDVDDYAENTGAADLAELEARLGPLPATITSTSRGADDASRQHFYALPEGDVELVTEIGKSIQIIQRHHRYSVTAPSIHPETGQPYVWYGFDGEVLDELPSLSDFEVLPEAWLEYLRAPEQKFSGQQYDGPPVESASETEERSIASIIRELDELPRPWHEGAGWRSVMFRVSCWLFRMVNSDAYAINEDQALQIILDHCPTDLEWTADDLMEQWESAKQSTAGQYADLPDDDRPKLLMPLDTLNAMSGELYDLAMAEPNAANAGSRWDLRQRIMVKAFSEGRDEVFAASAAWHSANAGIDLRNDEHGERKLWREVAQAKEKAAEATGASTAAAPAGERPPLRLADEADLYRLLSPTERSQLADWETERPWWGTRYTDWARTRVPFYNGPYHRMNRWHILSLLLSPYAAIPKGAGLMDLNIFSMTLGETTTGKSEAKRLCKMVMKAIFLEDDPNIGGDATANALVGHLIDRDGKASWFNADEAHGLFKEINGGKGNWRGSLTEKWTDLYEGEVPAILRAGQKDLSGITAKTYFVMHLMGTERGMVSSLDREMWDSGFLARFVWAIGENVEIDVDTLEVDEVTEYAGPGGYDHMPRQWAAEFAQTIRSLKLEANSPLFVLFEPDAKKRHLEVKRRLVTLYKGHKLESMLKPTLGRFEDTTRKIAALVALSDGSRTISLRHYLIALEQAEEWMANAVSMIRRTTETGFARNVSAVEQFVAGRPGGEVTKAAIYRHMTPAFEKFEVDKMIAQLVAEERVTDAPDPVNGRVIRLKTEAVAA